MIFKFLIQRITAQWVFRLDHDREIRVIGCFLATALHTADAGHIFQCFAVSGVDGLALGQRVADVLQLQHTKSGVDFAHLAVDARSYHGDFVHKTEVFQMVDALLGFGVGTDDGTTFKGVEHLGGMKAQHRQVAVAQHTAASVLHAKGMGSVVNHLEVVVVGNFLDGLDIARVAIAVHRHDGRGLRGDGRFDLGRVEVERVRVDVGKHRFDAVPQQRMRGGDEGIRRGDDLASDTQSLQGSDQGNGAVGKQRQVLDAKVVAQRLLQLLVKRATIGQNFVSPDFF